MKYDLTRPCPQCPFRTDCRPGWLGEERAEEIADSILSGAEFPCHKTTESDDDGNAHSTRNSQQCAGALIVQANEGQFNQMARIAGRLGLFNPDRLDMTAPVFDTFNEFIEHHAEVD